MSRSESIVVFAVRGRRMCKGLAAKVYRFLEV
jgi:hypothetical protein